MPFVLVHRPYPDLISNVLKLFADVQVTVVVVVGLVLRIDPADFQEETVAPAFYGNVMLMLLLLTVVPVGFALLYRSPLQRALGLLQAAALVDADSTSELSIRRHGLRKVPSVLVTMSEPQPWGLELETRQKKVVVSTVEAGSAADKAGIAVGMVLVSIAGVRVYDSANASQLGASAAVPTQLGFDSPASNTFLLLDSDDQRHRRTELDEPEPEQQPLSSGQYSLGVVGAGAVAVAVASDTEETQISIAAADVDGLDAIPVELVEAEEAAATTICQAKHEQAQPDDVRVEMNSGWGIKQTQANATARKEAARRALTSELQTLKMVKLRKRAAAAGASEDEIEVARDADAPKQAMIALILSRFEQELEPEPEPVHARTEQAQPHDERADVESGLDSRRVDMETERDVM